MDGKREEEGASEVFYSFNLLILYPQMEQNKKKISNDQILNVFPLSIKDSPTYFPFSFCYSIEFRI